MDSTKTKAVKRMRPVGLLTAASLTIIIWGLWAAREILIPLSLAALLAFLMAPIVRWLRSYRLPEWLAITIATIMLLLPLLAVGIVLVEQIQSLLQNLSSVLKGLEGFLADLAENPIAKRLSLSSSLTLPALLKSMRAGAGQGIRVVLTGLGTFVTVGTEAVFTIIFAIMMLAARNHLRHSSERIIAQLKNAESAKFVDDIISLVEEFLLGRLIVIVIISALSFVVLILFGISYSFLLGAAIGVLTLLPEVGFIVSLIPIVIIAVAAGHSALFVILLLASLTLIHLFEANILTPKLVGHRLNLNILATFVVMFAGGLLWGVWGMLLGIPFLAIVRIACNASPSLQPWAELLSERNDRLPPKRTFRLQRFFDFSFLTRRRPPEET